jgi:hypothetical protein
MITVVSITIDEDHGKALTKVVINISKFSSKVPVSLLRF